MSSDQAEDRIDELFLAAIELPVADRAAFIEQETRDESPKVRERLLELLVAEEEAGEGFAAVGSLNLHDLSADSLPDPRLGEKIGEYVIQERIASGGFGTAYLATREEPYKEQVAIKLLHRENLAAPTVVQRVLREMQALSDLRHPYIVSQLQSGITEHGEPFIVMEYVDGQTLSEYCDESALSIEERLKLFQKICEAVGFAHQNDWVHRDLKPSNILVTRDGVPKLLDFGIAKLGGTNDANATITHGIMGTPSYMSPEQFAGRAIGPATDVYALGAVLYELLSGHRAFDVMCAGIDDVIMEAIQNAVNETVPRSPSNVVAEDSTKTGVSKEQVARRRQTNPQSLRRFLSGDIDNIAMMALRKEPERRYRTVAEISDDIQCWLEHRPVKARPDSSAYRARKFVRRNRLPLAVSITFLLVLSAGLAAANFGRQASEARNIEQAKRLVESAQQYLDDDNVPRGVAELYAAYDAAPSDHQLRTGILRMLAGWSKYLGVPLAKTAGVGCMFSANGDKLLTTNNGETYITTLNTMRRERMDLDSDDEIVRQTISDGGKRVATLSAIGKVQVWNLENDTVVLSTQQIRNVVAMQFVFSELRVISITDEMMEVHSWDPGASSCKVVAAREVDAEINGVEFGCFESLIVRRLVDGEKRIELWDASTLETKQVVDTPIERYGPIVTNLHFTALSYDIGDVFRTNVWDGREQRFVASATGRVVDVHPESNRVLLRSQRQFVVKDIGSDRQFQLESEPLTMRSNASFLPDGSVVTGELRVRPHRHLALTRYDSAAGNPERFFHVSLGPRTRKRETDEMRTGHDNETTKFSPSGRYAILDTLLAKEIAHDSASTVPWLWDTRPLLVHSGRVDLGTSRLPAAVSYDGRHVVVSTSVDVRCKDAISQAEFQASIEATCIAVSESAGLVAIGRADGSVRFLRLIDKCVVSEQPIPNNVPIRGLCFDRLGENLLVFTTKTASVMNVASLLETAKYSSKRSAISLARFGGDTVALLTGGEAKELTAKDLQENRATEIPAGEGLLIDGTIAGERAVFVRIHEGAVYLSADKLQGQLGSDLDCVSAVVDDAGRIVAVGHEDGSVRIWDTVCRKPLMRRLKGFDEPAKFLAFSSNGSELMAMTERGDYKVWKSDFEFHHSELQLRSFLQVLTGYDLSKSSNGRWLSREKWISTFESLDKRSW